MPKVSVSVIVTSYNYEKYIKETLDSLVEQTYRDFDVIIVDDGSKDNSVEIIKEYVKKYPNFHLYTHPNNQNKGIVESMKLGISKSNSDYIVFLESDDYISKDYLEEKVDYIKSHPDSVLIINDIKQTGKDWYITHVRNYFKTRNVNHCDFETFYYGNLIPTFSVVMIKSDVLKSLDFNSQKAAWLDWWLWRQVSLNYPIHYIDKKLTYWRIHNDSYINRDNESNSENRKEFMKASDLMLIKKYPKKTFEIFGYRLKFYVNKILQSIFSLKNNYHNDKKHKVITILGFKIKIKVK